MTSPLSTTRLAILPLTCWVGLLALIGPMKASTGQETGAPARSSKSLTAARGVGANSVDLQIGIGGIYRPGNWTAIRALEASDAAETASAIEITTVETLDGDGVRVRYDQAAHAGGNRAYAVPGTASAPLAIYAGPAHSDAAEDDSERLVVKARFPATAIEPAKPWVVVIGDPLGIETIGKNDLLGREAAVAVSIVQTAADVPDQTLGWEGVDLVVINQKGAAVLETLTERQIATLQAWVQRGGRMLVSLGKGGGPLLQQSPWLAELTGVSPESPTIRLDPSALESFTSSQTRLPNLDGITLGETGGRTLLAGRTASRQPARLAVEHLTGLGRVVVTSFAVDSPELEPWPQRLQLVTRLQGGLLDSDSEKRRESRTITSVPYNDLAGQLRAALDRFDSHSRVPFSVVSLILLALAALVGPLDYLLVNRLIGKPLVGWISFPVSVVAIATLVVSLSGSRPVGGNAGSANPSATDAALNSGGAVTSEISTGGLRANRVEWVDIVAVGQTPIGRATSLSHVSSPVAVRADLPITIADGWALRSDAPIGDVALTRPYGYAGPSFGGIAIVGEDHSMPPYQVRIAAVTDRESKSTVHDVAAVPSQFPIAPAGSKSFHSSWTFTPALGRIDGLAQRRGNELLTGSITNPLPVDILDGAIIFGNWVYLLPTRFRAGQTIESIESLRQKNFRWHLTRREALENSSRVEAWDVEMHDDLGRLVEVMMFESSIGGRDYTGLGNRVFHGLDLSYALAAGHAVLYGRFAEPIFNTGLAAERPTVSAVRVVLPVAPPAIKK